MSLSQNAQEPIFALDIGTRTVIGIIGFMEGNNFQIIAEESEEHQGRSMYDGQIHDIPQVAEVVAGVKHRLEQKTGLHLDKVAVAAAGRSLKTIHCTAETEHDSNREIEMLDIRSLELAALRQAHRMLEANQVADYYCVGHCVITYMLDGMPVSNLLGHRGDILGADIVATFLPVSVVNSLYAVLSRVSLEPVNLTLEPIAAIDAAIPASFRLLNLALVDIGAGTSDIAITREGSIIAYGMVPMAGDEITELIMERLLVEFNEAERIKRLINEQDQIAYTDIVGITGHISKIEAVELISPVLNKLADTISAAILELNGGISPKTVFCVGGGSRSPGLTAELALRLELDPERVVIRDRSLLRNLLIKDDVNLNGPEGVTVVGIATVALGKLGYEFLTIKLNGSQYKLFNTKNINVSQALGLIRFDPRHLIGKNGRNLKFILNGKEHTMFGELGQPARIYVNNQEANLLTTVKDGDDITVLKATQGKDATARIADFSGQGEIRFWLNGVERRWIPQMILNGVNTHPTTLLNPGDRLEIKDKPKVGEVAAYYGYHPGGQALVNGKKATTLDLINQGDQIEIVEPDNPAAGIKVILNGREIRLTKNEPIFVDIFNYLDINTTNAKGKLVMRLNGERAQYIEPIKEGDNIEVYWDEGLT